ncbi:MAG: GNAT family N-acetyltransferase [Chloroflexi bacterium]|nr:GNAT family N-acetyltransferase [Chloroflexota bacterium]
MLNQAMSTPMPSDASIEITECKTKAERRKFIDFQWEIYKGDQYWVPPLISEREAFYDPGKNVFFEHSDVALFLARRAGKVVGTIAAIHNKRHNEYHNDRTGFFGSFEVINDFDVARALLDTARDWLKARGLNVMRGPATFSANEEFGLLIDGFDSEPQLMMTYNPRYYIDLLERYGFKKEMDLYAWWASTEHSRDIIVGGRFERVTQMAMKRGKFTVRTADMSRFDEEVDRIKKIYNKAWLRNWGFVPMTDHEIDHLGANLKQIVDPDMVFIAEKDGEPIGVSISLPNVNRPLRKAYPNPKTPEIWTLLKFLWYRRTMVNALRLIILGVLPEYRMSGVDAVMIYMTLEVALKKGLIGGECSWILETNDDMNRVIQYADPELYKKYRIYDYPLDTAR